MLNNKSEGVTVLQTKEEDDENNGNGFMGNGELDRHQAVNRFLREAWPEALYEDALLY